VVLTTLQRFLSKIEYNSFSGCWLWTGVKDGGGYGAFADMGTHKAHRWAYSEFRGEIGQGLHVCHKCDVPSCVNPFHLFVGTQKENIADMMRKGRHRDISTVLRGSKQPQAKLTEDMVIEIRMRVEEGESQASLAREFYVSGNTVGRIIRRETWKHI
jgi:hypothetical protein